MRRYVAVGWDLFSPRLHRGAILGARSARRCATAYLRTLPWPSPVVAVWAIPAGKSPCRYAVEITARQIRPTLVLERGYVTN